MWYSFNENSAINITPIDIDRVHSIIELNKKGVIVDNLIEAVEVKTKDILGFSEIEQSPKTLNKPNSNQKRRKKPNRKVEPNVNKTPDKK